MNDDYKFNSNTSNALPSEIDTLDDAIAYLQKARQTMGGNVKFRMLENGYSTDPDEYMQVGDVVLIGNKSLMAKSLNSDNQDYVLFVS